MVNRSFGSLLENPACVWVYFKIIIKSLEKMKKVCYKLLLSMVGVAQLVEHLVVAQDAVGSSPITHPIRKLPVRDANAHRFCCLRARSSAG